MKDIDMRFWVKSFFFIVLISVLCASPLGLAQADHEPVDPNPIKNVDFEQKLDAQVPLDLAFRDESGRSIQLGEYFGGRPVILLFAYYECPMLCTLVLNDLTKALQELTFEIGEQFEVVTVSMDPGETPEMAAAKKAAYLQEYGRPEAEKGWHFLTGEQAEIDQLARSVGFQYVYDPELDQYAHPTGLIVLTPGGRVSRYILGIDYSPRDVRLGLVDASARKIGSPVDQFFLLCYAYDPQQGRYTLLIEKVLRFAGLATVGAIGAMIFFLIRRERASPDNPVKPEGYFGRPEHD